MSLSVSDWLLQLWDLLERLSDGGTFTNSVIEGENLRVMLDRVTKVKGQV